IRGILERVTVPDGSQDDLAGRVLESRWSAPSIARCAGHSAIVPEVAGRIAPLPTAKLLPNEQQLHPEAQQRLAGTSTHLMRMAPHVSDEAWGKEFHRLLQAHPPEHARAIARWYGLRKGDQPRDLGRKARSASGKLPEALPEGPYLSK